MLFALGIFLMVFSVGLGLWQTGRSQGERVDTQLEAARSMAQLLVLLEDDLLHLLPGSRLATKARPDPTRALTLARVPTFFSSGPGGLPLNSDLTPLSERVTWVFDQSSGRVFRNGVALSAGPFVDVLFTYVPAGTKTGDTLGIDLSVAPPGADPRTPNLRTIRRTFTRHCAIATVNHLGEDWVGP